MAYYTKIVSTLNVAGHVYGNVSNTLPFVTIKWFELFL